METNNKILILDDSTTNVLLLQAVLNESGYQLYTANTVKDALCILEKEIPDLIILDLLMPKVNGYDFLCKIRSESSTDKIPVIIVSGVSDPLEIKKAVDYGGIIDFVQKPVDIQHISDLVDDVFAKLQNAKGILK